MNKKLLITSFGAVFTIAVLLAGSIAPAMAGNVGLGEAPSPSCGGKATFQGTSGNDLVSGLNGATSGDDIFNMKDGDDTVLDEAGVENEGGSDIFRMGDGNDFVFSAGGNDTICLGDGNDFANTADGWIDLIKCGEGVDKVTVDPFDIWEECEKVTIVNGEF